MCMNVVLMLALRYIAIRLFFVWRMLYFYIDQYSAVRW